MRHGALHPALRKQGLGSLPVYQAGAAPLTRKPASPSGPLSAEAGGCRHGKARTASYPPAREIVSNSISISSTIWHGLCKTIWASEPGDQNGRPCGIPRLKPVSCNQMESPMTIDLTRRSFLGSVAAGAALAVPAGLVLPGRPAHAAGERLVVVQWGAGWIEVSKKLIEPFQKETGDQIAWELHAGGAMAIVAKIRPQWPRVPYNVVSAWNPVFSAMDAEGWLDTITVDEVPNLKDIPDSFVQKNAKGQAISVPLSTAGAFWGYRTDLLDKPLENLDQLLEPRFKGKICVPFPVNLSGLLLVTLAIQRGGNERNVEPGWEFLKELAKRGNIGRVINNNSEFINAMSGGDLSVGREDSRLQKAGQLFRRCGAEPGI
ncbi:MAG: hypothetical protein B7Z15_07125 [Rhizobiales bacterium 32-66-8]|nr:MAG: hypothetical protein B7Z15_07125 [Rhizobiales bacterium 32-66-8]